MNVHPQLAVRVAVLALACGGPAMAQAPAVAGSWNTTVFGATDNRSKEESKSDRGSFFGAMAEWRDSADMFYAGPGFETIDDNGAEVELNGVVGVRPEYRGFDLNFSATYKWRVTSDPGLDDDEFELTADAERRIGPARTRVRLQYAPDAGGRTDSFTWIELRQGWALTPTLEATASVGQRDRQGGVDYTGWNVGLAYDLTRSLQLDLRYHDTNIEHGGPEFADQVVAAIFLDF